MPPSLCNVFSNKMSELIVPEWILWCFGIVISNAFSTQRSFQPIPWGILWCLGIMITGQS